MYQRTTTPRMHGESNHDFFRRVMAPMPVIDVAMYGQNEAYLAVKSGNGIVAYVAVMRIARRTKDWDDIEFALAPETANPKLANCPRRIIEQLDPLDKIVGRGTQPWLRANAWRTRAAQHAETRVHASLVKEGSVVVFNPPLKFEDGHVAARFRREPDPAHQRDLFKSLDNEQNYRIPGWRARNFMVEVNAAE